MKPKYIFFIIKHITPLCIWKKAPSDNPGRARGGDTVWGPEPGGRACVRPRGRASHTNQPPLQSPKNRLGTRARLPCLELPGGPASDGSAFLSPGLGINSQAAVACEHKASLLSGDPVSECRVAGAYLLRALDPRRWHSTVVVACFPPFPISCFTSHCRGSLVWVPKIFTPFFTLALRARRQARESHSIKDLAFAEGPTHHYAVIHHSLFSRPRFRGPCRDG